MQPPDQPKANDALLSIRGLRTYLPVRGRLLGRRDRWCRAVDGVDLEVAGSETLGLVGESGCGKSTLARTIMRLTDPTAGTILFDGVDVLAATGNRLKQLRRNMQIIFQDPLGSLNPRITIGRSIEEPLLIHRVGNRDRRRERVAVLLEQVGLQAHQANRYPHELSGGQRQRVSIARAIALEPRFIVCDEPVSALDVSVQAHVLRLLGDLKDRFNMTLLFISHDLAVVRNFCDRVAVMYVGKIVEIADSSAIFENPRHPYTMALRSASPRPEPQRSEKRRTIQGDVPSAINPPGGCAFHPRCPFATDECRKRMPELGDVAKSSGTRLVACHHAEQNLSW